MMIENKVKRFVIPEFEYGEIVYLISDEDNIKFIVLGYKVIDKSISYWLNARTYQGWYSEPEISRVKYNL